MAKAEVAFVPLSQHQTLWLVSAAIGVLLPLAPYLPYWLDTLAGLALFTRGWLLYRRFSLPPGWLINLVALAGMAGVGLHYHTLFGKDPDVALLALFLALKLFEMRSRRDAYVAILLQFFLILSQFFYTQSLLTGATMLITVLLVVSSMAALNRDDQTVRQQLRVAARLLLQAIPFMLALFIFFPRVAGPLWGLPADAYGGMTGLADSMAPGSISQLTLSDAIAFRVRFEGPVPARHALYWRGPVMNDFDGQTWRIDRTPLLEHLPYRVDGATVGYEVTLEPHNRYWLFALEMPATIAPEGVFSADFQMFARGPVRTRIRYSLRSSLEQRTGLDETAETLDRARRLPPDINPRARELARELRIGPGGRRRSDASVAAALLARYREQPFVYTLTPPLLGHDSVDQFLFDTRRGFCEHYASSFVFVMRAAGIPARVVTGYQGGEINPVDGYLLVRQLDAHAWAEIWLQGRGWQRVDPTAAIAPNRVEENLAAVIPASEPLPLLSRPEMDWLRQARFRWEAISNRWNQWVLGYDTQRQLGLMRALGMNDPDWRSLASILAILCGGLTLAFAGWALRQWHRPDPVQAQWQRFSKKLAAYKLSRHPWEGSRDYSRRVRAGIPGRDGEIEAICTLYEALRYGRLAGAGQLAELRQRINDFRP
ncbi:MAG: DUF3488 domain-containing transglutaminase family protein [Proteobacteria bacterium]|nr:DUF3488 domain-containing transglutaminase family protein [Pseudomonadota bacterium]HQR02674.1 DUF3488 and transglutaminase-like domain-containing protein [Rhodocyclaceae bacterium]